MDIRAAIASCGGPAVTSQLQVMLPDEGGGKLRSFFPGAMTWIWSQARGLLAVNQAARLLSCATASIGPLGLLRKVCAIGTAAAAAPARTRSPATARSTRTRRR